ncbi:MAG: flagellar biosynthesis protein FlgJ [Clostridia bacterium]|nr:flagellar biosynthesis protein FlgJ [Clostridia bacterium]
MKIEPNNTINNLTLAAGKVKNSEGKFSEILNKVEKGKDDAAKLMEACQQFESIFIHQMISQMRATIPEGGLLEKSTGEEIFQDMLDQQYAENISKAGGIGLAKILYDQLAPRINNKA